MRRFLIVGPVFLLLSCGGDDSGLTAPTTGTIEVRTTTSGEAPGGYTVSLDGAAPQPIGATATVTFSDVVPGAHAVELGGLPAGCTVAGENPRTVSVTAGASATVEFAVTCTPPNPSTGTLQIVTATTGSPPDPDGYAVAVDGGPAQPIGVAASVTVTGVAPGNHTVTLSGVAANCAVAGDNPRTVGVTAAATVEVSFTIACGAVTVGRWTRMESGTDFSLLSVWGSSATDVFTVGEPGGSFTSTIFHYDGQAWTEQFTQDGATLTGLWASGPTDVFAVGSDPLGDFGYQGAILRYNGSNWSPMAATGLGLQVALHSVWGSSATDVFAVGEDFVGFSNALVAHFDGTTWSRVPLAEEADRVLRDVHGSSGQDVWAVGNVDLGSFLRRGPSARYLLRDPGVRRVQSSYGLIVHFNGTGWTEQVRQVPNLAFFGVWSAAPNSAFAVGAVGDDAAVYRFDGTNWSPMTVPPVGPLLEVWGASATDVYAVGEGTILHYDGSAWTEVQATEARLTGVWGSSAADVFAVGGGGTIFHGTPAVAAGRGVRD